MDNRRRGSMRQYTFGNAITDEITSNSSTKVDKFDKPKLDLGSDDPDSHYHSYNYNNRDTNIEEAGQFETLSPESDGNPDTIVIKSPGTIKQSIVPKQEDTKFNKNNKIYNTENGNSYSRNLKKNIIRPQLDQQYMEDDFESNKMSKKFDYRNFTKQRRYNSQTIRSLMGEPLPLPYLQKDKKQKDSNTSQFEKDPIITHVNDKFIRKPLTFDELDKRRHIMNNKWKKLLHKDQNMVNFKLSHLPKLDNFENDDMNPENKIGDDDITEELNNLEHELSNPSRINPRLLSVHKDLNVPRFPSRTGSISLNPLSYTSESNVSNLQEEINANGRKLDLILELLNEEKNPKSWTGNVNISREMVFWSSCIILLLICNILAYYI